MFWLVALGVVGGIWLFTVGLLALLDADIGTKQRKSITPIDAVARAEDRGPFPPPT
jgi:hypothetical protein